MMKLTRSPTRPGGIVENCRVENYVLRVVFRHCFVGIEGTHH